MVNKLNRYFSYVILNTVAGSFLCPMRLRRLIYKLFGHNVCMVYSGCFIGVGNGKLRVGQNSYCNYRCFFDLGNDITIGDNCSIAYNVTFVNSTHIIGNSEHRAEGVVNYPIVIEDGVWIGANATIMPGVTIAKGCVIAAGALVTKTTEPNGLYAGVPSKRIKNLQII